MNTWDHRSAPPPPNKHCVRPEKMTRTKLAFRPASRLDVDHQAVNSGKQTNDCTGHYYVRPRPVCLSPSCARSAKNRLAGACGQTEAATTATTPPRPPRTPHHTP